MKSYPSSRFVYPLLAVLAGLCLFAASATAMPFESFTIRNGSSGTAPVIQANTGYVSDGLEFIVSEGGMKAGLGTNALNGATVGDILGLSITRHDDATRFAPGSGPAVAPYFNLWVTDGAGQYAVIANEPSNPAFQPLLTANADGSRTYDFGFSDLSDKTAKVYETPGWNSGTSWLHNAIGNAGPLTFADLATFQIAPPPAAYIADSANGVGSGAPDVLGTNEAYGFNWVFGDTLSNYVSGDEGYVVSGAMAVSAAGTEPVPEPGTFALLGGGLFGLAWFRRRLSRM